VIAHALHKSAPGVRMGRIKELEAEQRKIEAGRAEHRAMWETWEKIAAMPGAGELIPLGANGYADQSAMNPAQRMAYTCASNSGYRLSIWHPDDEEANAHGKEIHGAYWSGFDSYDFLTADKYGAKPFRRLTPKEYAELYLKKARNPDQYNSRWAKHLELRLAYENQMLEAQGGRAAYVEMIPGGWIGKHQIQKVNKSPATGRVVSVQVWGTRRDYTKESGYTEQETRPGLLNLNIERLKAEVYRAPTEEELETFNAQKKEAKKERGVVPTINPTRENAELLQTQLNATAAETDKGQNYPRKPGEVEEMTQARFSGMYKDYRVLREYRGCKIRMCVHGWQNVESVVVLTDKHQKAFPEGVLEMAMA